jgi:hypothetical protein
MALFDPTWFTGFQTAATSFATGCAGAFGAWLALRRKYSEDTTEIKKDRGEEKWISNTVQERSDAFKEVGALRAQLTEYATKNARLEAKLEMCDEAAKGREEERHRQAGACEERVRSLSEELLEKNLLNGRLFIELVTLDKALAERLMLEHWRPVPPGKGDEPP